MPTSPRQPPSRLLKRDPGGPMLLVLTARVRFEMLERSPVLNDDLHSEDVPEETALRTFLELANHRLHREKHRQPFVDLPRLVDPHADQEDDEIAVELSRHAGRDDLGHEIGPPGITKSKTTNTRNEEATKTRKHETSFGGSLRSTRPDRPLVPFVLHATP